MSSDVKFSAGDHVVYPSHGVGRVTGLKKKQISGDEIEFVDILFERERMTLSIPVTKTVNSGLRPLSSRNVMDKVFDVLKGKTRARKTMWSRRAQEYEAKINSGNPISVAQVIRDLHRNSRQYEQSYSERQILSLAVDRLAREIAAIENIGDEEAQKRLESFLSNAA